MTKEASWWEGGAGDRQPWPEAPAGTGTGTFPFGSSGAGHFRGVCGARHWAGCWAFAQHQLKNKPKQKNQYCLMERTFWWAAENHAESVKVCQMCARERRGSRWERLWIFLGGCNIS